MNLRELMSTQVKTCTPSDSVVKAAQIMKSNDCGVVPITDGQKLVGMLTDRDIILHAVANNQNLNSTTCKECMTTNIITGTPEMSAQDATDLMSRHQIRRLPVVENNRLVGICALADLATVDIHANEAGFALSGISQETNAFH